MFYLFDKTIYKYYNYTNCNYFCVIILTLFYVWHGICGDGANYHNFADIYRKRNKNMRRVRLTEGQLHNVIRESVNNILNEISDELKKRSYDKARMLKRDDQAAYFANSEGDKNGHGAGFIPDFNDKYAIDSNDFKTYADYENGSPTLHSSERNQSRRGFVPHFLQKRKWGEYTNKLGMSPTTYDKKPELNGDYDYQKNLNNRPAYHQARDAWEKLGNVHNTDDGWWNY